MKRGLLQWVIILGLCSAGEASLAGVFDPAERGIMQFIHGYQLDKTGPGRVLPRVDWLSDLMEVLPDVIDIFIDDDKPQRDEQDSQRDQEQAWREQERAQQAEQEAQWQREEAQRERERAEEAERREAEAREEAHRSRELAEEAQGTAEEAKDTAEQARGTAQEAKGVAQEAKSISQQARGAAQEAKGMSKQAMGTADEAKGVAQEARGTAVQAMGTAEHAVGTAVETQVQVEQAHKRVGRQNTFVALLALLTLMALVLAMRKPRQAIVRVAGNAMEPLRRSFKPAGHKPAAAPSRETARVVLTGFDSRGKPVNIPLPDAELDPKRGGFTLGRHHLLVDRTLDDERVSKRHVRFTYSGHGYFVEDLNSTNGTVINGTQPCPPFKPMPLRPGDTVRLGGIELSVSA